MKLPMRRTTRLRTAALCNILAFLASAHTITAAPPPAAPSAMVDNFNHPHPHPHSHPHHQQQQQQQQQHSSFSSPSAFMTSSSPSSSSLVVVATPQPPPSPPGSPPPNFPPPSPPPTPPPSHQRPQRVPTQEDVLLFLGKTFDERSSSVFEFEFDFDPNSESKSKSKTMSNTSLKPKPKPHIPRQLVVPNVMIPDLAGNPTRPESESSAALRTLASTSIVVPAAPAITEAKATTASTTKRTKSGCTSTLIQFPHFGMLGAGYRGLASHTDNHIHDHTSDHTPNNTPNHNHGSKGKGKGNATGTNTTKSGAKSTKTSTTYLSTTTTTRSVDCGGCSEIAILQLGGVGPVIVPALTPVWDDDDDVTVTLPVETITMTACAA
ncbi:hypothetical protein L228DRAFT_39417 [Xylona heveae TC161]|uniref:Uncharacterized protein n=1 Tax=Xylona heveae (strain CBS 132557 / TC161) TaxID=1328760 RepID=A0A164ZYY7_XYLHT|nr:hypothetical protein L228DRAFT_39417 [Xylona heveae TC161]KZF19722.1 hypothetical protein L228DRAFT_39417 [Xylona heveae TC161]